MYRFGGTRGGVARLLLGTKWRLLAKKCAKHEKEKEKEKEKRCR